MLLIAEPQLIYAMDGSQLQDFLFNDLLIIYPAAQQGNLNAFTARIQPPAGRSILAISATALRAKAFNQIPQNLPHHSPLQTLHGSYELAVAAQPLRLDRYELRITRELAMLHARVVNHNQLSNYGVVDQTPIGMLPQELWRLIGSFLTYDFGNFHDVYDQGFYSAQEQLSNVRNTGTYDLLV